MGFLKLLGYVYWWVKPSQAEKVLANRMYDRRDLSKLKKLINLLGRKDPVWYPRLFEPTTLGIRAWEYGVLLNQTSFRGQKVLDVGAGNSRLPQYLGNCGAKVTLLDMEDPLEETERKRAKNMHFVLGDMTKLKFKDNSFDRVVCISAIEHVDMKTGGGFYDQKEYVDRAYKAIAEMIRVTKKGGIFYLTTDFYLPVQKSDKWVGSVDKIRGAFPWECLEKFVTLMKKNGLKLNPETEIDQKILSDDSLRSSFRGRFFTTFAFMGVKI